MTKTDFDSQFGPIAMPKPFAQGGDVATIPFTQDGGNFNFDLGFDPAFSSPKSNNGKYVERAQLNAIGNLATRNDFHRRCGGLNTFDPDFADAIGGYPKGAVLCFVNNSQLFYVLSLQDDNTFDFRNGVDGFYWEYLNTDKAIPSDRELVINIENISAETNFVIGSIVANRTSGYLIGATPDISVIPNTEVTSSFESGKYVYFAIGTGIMIKDVTEGNDGLLPAIDIGDGQLISNGWSCLIGNPGYFFGKDENISLNQFLNFSSDFKGGHKYILLSWCGSSYTIPASSQYFVTHAKQKLEGQLKVYYS